MDDDRNGVMQEVGLWCCVVSHWAQVEQKCQYGEEIIECSIMNIPLKFIFPCHNVRILPAAMKLVQTIYEDKTNVHLINISSYIDF